MLVFRRGKPEYPEKNLSKQGREPTTNSTHIWRRREDLNPGNIGGRWVLSPPRHPCSTNFMTEPLLMVEFAYIFEKFSTFPCALAASAFRQSRYNKHLSYSKFIMSPHYVRNVWSPGLRKTNQMELKNYLTSPRAQLFEGRLALTRGLILILISFLLFKGIFEDNVLHPIIKFYIKRI